VARGSSFAGAVTKQYASSLGRGRFHEPTLIPMSVMDETGNAPRRTAGDIPLLRAGTAWLATIGFCLATALGISAILGASLGETAVRLAGSGVTCGLDALFAVGAATLYQRSSSQRAPAVIGVLASAVSAALSLAAVWGTSLGATAGRIVVVASLLAFAVGLSGFLLSQQRGEDPSAIRGLMFGTLLLEWVVATALIVDIVFATGSRSTVGPGAAGVQVPLSGLSFDRFLGVASLLTLLGLLLLPVLRRAHPAYRGGRATQSTS
jgi:hypothetical protein